jgi:hypothetical protein
MESGIVGTSYLSLPVTPGTTYKFKVQARNSVGLSKYSAEISILAAQVPNQPNTPVTSIVNEAIVISWRAPYNGGSPITSYFVTIR